MFAKVNKIQLRKRDNDDDTQTAGGQQTSQFSNFLSHLIAYILNQADIMSPFILPSDLHILFYSAKRKI